tara:strand:- start:368 stop:745 length:378 start_codon:yes stop_codon:yes gene_type:complete
MTGSEVLIFLDELLYVASGGSVGERPDSFKPGQILEGTEERLEYLQTRVFFLQALIEKQQEREAVNRGEQGTTRSLRPLCGEHFVAAQRFKQAMSYVSEADTDAACAACKGTALVLVEINNINIH